ncbi:MAG TPA: Lrp/AsnC family transcriptional regulator [Burkholderiaceae bacterium]
MESIKPEIDDIDLRIMALLQEDGRLSIARLADKLAMSETPVWRRVKRLEEEGHIRGYRAELDRRKLGYGLTVFVQIHMADHTGHAPDRFEAAVRALPEVLSCHIISGQADYLLTVLARDMDHYGEFVANTLRQLPGVTSLHSSMVIREIKASASIPVGE